MRPKRCEVVRLEPAFFVGTIADIFRYILWVRSEPTLWGQTMGLTVKEIDSAKPSGKPYKLSDSGGLCLLIAPSGAKLWRYRFDGREKMMALGEYPLVNLAQAR